MLCGKTEEEAEGGATCCLPCLGLEEGAGEMLFIPHSLFFGGKNLFVPPPPPFPLSALFSAPDSIAPHRPFFARHTWALGKHYYEPFSTQQLLDIVKLTPSSFHVTLLMPMSAFSWFFLPLLPRCQSYPPPLSENALGIHIWTKKGEREAGGSGRLFEGKREGGGERNRVSPGKI